MGGDEFCALLEAGDQTAGPTVAGAARALSEYGEGFTITCSYGSIQPPREAQDASEALRLADQRRYAQKNAGRASASRQSRDVLVRALTERNPDASDAMVAHRPSTHPRSAEVALLELRKCAGAQFDPVVVEVFAAALKARDRALEPVA